MSHPQDTIVNGLLCPACGQHTRTQFEQPTIGKPPIICTHCTNPDCAGYYMTKQIDVFFETYGAYAMTSDERDAINLIQHIYPWLNDTQALDLLMQEPVAILIAEALASIEDFREFARCSGLIIE